MAPIYRSASARVHIIHSSRSPAVYMRLVAAHCLSIVTRLLCLYTYMLVEYREYKNHTRRGRLFDLAGESRAGPVFYARLAVSVSNAARLFATGAAAADTLNLNKLRRREYTSVYLYAGERVSSVSYFDQLTELFFLFQLNLARHFAHNSK